MTDLDPDSASRQLRVIRSLMERATVYRSISAPTAFVGGLLSLGGGAVAYLEPLGDGKFLALWLMILLLTCVANAMFLYQGSRRRGEVFLSSGMKLAAASLAPAFVGTGLLTFLLHDPIALAIIWIMGYGIGLLATQHFAPRSLVVLGLTFFVAGCILLLSGQSYFLASAYSGTIALFASAIMAATFGGFHLVYAATVWLAGERNERVDISSTGPGNV
jgi:hypothetical protein